MAHGTAYNSNIRRSKRSNNLMKLYFGGCLFAVMSIPAILSGYGYPPLHSLLALILIGVCLYPTTQYLSQKKEGLPTLAVLCAAYGFQFGLPVFTREATIQLMGLNIQKLSDTDVAVALIMAILGVSAQQLGYYWFRRSKVQNMIPVARLPLDKTKALLYCVLMVILVPLVLASKVPILEFLQPPSSILRVLQNQVLVAIGVLGWIVYSLRDSRLYKVGLYALVFIVAVRGISTGALEEALVPFAVLFVVKWRYTKKIPVGPILAATALIVFLSPVKDDYRKELVNNAEREVTNQSVVSKAFLWIEQATEFWADTLSGSQGFGEATSSATSRVDLIHQFAYIHSMTPSVIPFQYGATYSYFAVALVPRVIWPDKPTAGSANTFYGVSYGITDEEGAQRSTFGVSLLGESYINFSWFGVISVMFLQGALLCILQHSFGGARSGAGGQAIFLAFFVFFLNGIGSSAEILFGNILQNLVLGYLLLLWARDKLHKRQSSAMGIYRPSTASLSSGSIAS